MVVADRLKLSGPLREHPLRPGQRVNLGVCGLRKDGRAKARIVGAWDNGQKEPWWLATNLEDLAGRVAEYYDRRMAVEEAFHGGKGCRYGIKMRWRRIHRCVDLNRLFLPAAIGIQAKDLFADVFRIGPRRFAILWPQAEIRTFAWEQK